jgi:hypothetical protein
MTGIQIFQSASKNGSPTETTNIDLHFSLDDKDIAEFHTAIGSSINEVLPLRFSIGSKKVTLSIAKPGRGHVTLNKKATIIAEYVSKHCDFQYIPSIRTASSATDIIAQLVNNQLRTLERDDAYSAAVKAIEAVQQPVLDALSSKVQSTIKRFLPSVKKITLSAQGTTRSRLLRRDITITIDDGVATSLDRKGDGVQSLVALAIMRHQSEGRESGQSIIAIEEPNPTFTPKQFMSSAP